MSHLDGNKQRDMEVSLGSSDHDYCRIPSGNSERESRLAISQCERLKRVDAKYSSVSSIVQSERDTVYRPFCFHVESPSSSVLLLENRSLQQWPGCLSGTLDSCTRVCFSSILSDRESFMPSPSDLQFIAKPTKSNPPIIVQNKNLQLVAWTVSEIESKRQEFQRRLPILSQQPEGKEQLSITRRPGISGVAGVVEN